MGWEYFIVWIVTTIASIALAPKPPKPKPAALTDFDLPVAEEGRPIPVIFGTVDITGANVLWYGNLRAKPIKKSSLFGSQTVGYKYFLGVHFGLCHGPVNAVTRIAAGEKQAWTGNVTSNSTITIDQPSLFGGEKREGGIQGSVDIELGGDSQTENAYLDAQITGTVSANRGILGAVLRGTSSGGAYVGTTPYVKGFAFRAKRTTAGWYTGSAWYSGKAEITGGHMNPAHIIYEAMTNPEWGMGLSSSLMNTASWQAAADTLYTEGFGLSLIWNQQTTVEDFATQILNHIAGAVVFRLDTGQYELRLIRGDYDAPTLPVYDESNVLSVEKYEIRGWGETVNELTVIYTDPTTKKATSITAQDMANIAIQGRIAESVNMPGIQSATIAAKVAQRELASRSTPMAVVQLKVNRKAWNANQGDLFKFSWPKYEFSNVVFRALKVQKGSLEDGSITVDALQDIYAFGSGSYLSNPSAPSVPVEDLETTDETAGGSVVSTTTTAPPGSPSDGDSYYVPTGATGAWSTHVGEIATWNADTGAWEYQDVSGSPVVYDDTAAGYVTLVGDGSTTVSPYGGTPQNAQTGNYTVALGDNGKHIFHASGAGAGDTYTLPANGTTALPIGFTVTFVNLASDTVAIACSDTLTWVPSGGTGTRTLAQYGWATAIKVTSTGWVIRGDGLT